MGCVLCEKDATHELVFASRVLANYCAKHAAEVKKKLKIREVEEDEGEDKS